MNTRRKWISGLVLGTGLASTVPAVAQSSVTLYGIIDSGIGYQSNQTTLGSTFGGHSSVSMIQGVWAGNRFGFKGSEDLGGGTKALFQLEAGFNSTNGAAQFSGLMFSRLAWVGVSDKLWGTLAAGRQNSSYFQTFLPISPINWLTAFYGAHPGDIDGMDADYRANNTLEYTSSNLAGFTVSGSYSLGGVAGSTNAGSTWSVGVRYAAGPVTLATGFWRISNANSAGGAWGADSTSSNNGGQQGVSALTNGYQTARAQQRAAFGAGYRFSDAWDVSATVSNVQYIPGSGSKFSDIAIFNTGGAVLHWKPLAAWDFGAGYSYTAATRANGIHDSARYNQFNLTQYYSLSVRTGLYAAEAYGRATGNTLGTAGDGNIVPATATFGDGFNASPSSSGHLVAVGAGVIHRF